MPEQQPPASAWGNVITIAQAEQSNAPALWADPSRLVAAWIGSDDVGVHQDVRRWADGSRSPVTVLPLPPTHPYAQSWAGAHNDNLHLLWLDANEAGQTQLFSALITPQFAVERGPTPVSDGFALRYAAAADFTGRLWTVWSGGLLSEPTLYLRSIDSAGRPQQTQQVAINADYPALAHANDGTLLLFWLERGQLMRATIVNGVVSDPVALTRAVYLDSGDRLHHLSVGIDQTHAYVFWNITRTTGQNETWLAAGAISAPTWEQPVLLQYDVQTNTAFETGFNTGAALIARQGETPLTWAAPLAGQYAVLPVAVQSPTGLAVVYFGSGAIAGYQEIMSGERLIGSPALVGDRNRHLYLAWAQPSISGAANLLLTATQFDY